MTIIIVAAYFTGPMIPKAYAWNLSAIPNSITTTPGSTVAYSISVFYESGMEPPMALPIHLLVSPPEFGITVDFLPSSGMLEFSSTMRVHVDPAKAPGVYMLNVWANPEGSLFPGPDNRAIIVQLIVEPSAPPATDWALSNPTLSPPSPNAGDPVTFSVVLRALSSTQPYPQSLTMVAELDGVQIGGGPVSYPGPTGGPVTAHTTPPWTATAGTHAITWFVAPGTPDPNPANNEASRTFTVGPPPAQFDFEVLVSPSERTVTPGSSASFTVNVNLLSGSTKSVTLSLSGEPAGVTESFSPSSGNPTFSSSLTLSTDSSVAAGSYSMTITGKGGGMSRTATVKLIVSQAKDFRIDVSPTSQTVNQGQTTSYSISVVGLNGFNSQVSLSVSGLPAGSGHVFSTPSGTPGFSSTLTVNLPNSVDTGSLTLTIKGSGGGLDRIANVLLVINAATQAKTETETVTATTGFYDMLQQNTLLLGGVLAAVVLVLAALLLRGRKPSYPPPPSEPPKPCPVCGKPLMFVKQYDRWYCNNCKEYR